MVRSMTGYGKGIAENSDARVTIEMKSVNHRYLDLNIKLPKKLNFLESTVRNKISESIFRGKVDVYITLNEHSDACYQVSINDAIALKYYESISAMAEKLGVDNDMKASSISRLPDVIELEEMEADEDSLKELVLKALDDCIKQFIEARIAEGNRLENDLVSKMDEMLVLVDKLEERSPKIIEEYRTKLLGKVHELLEDTKIDENRIAQEVVLYADKICIDEEMVRLKSHVAETRSVFDLDKEVGRKLDFLAQELNREANTILSKSTDVEIADIGITLKTLIEKVREQIQNIE
ncbi:MULTISPECIES: YicC/YloC family endoribonuclease [Pseudobutyrivibrio]|uniref:TIGR00255 family protein n=1 Tax=Pseudobutyrivibrio xylanivorans TaxID=185007 RepID=A0A1G5S502_PSEXY|nr:MULTISPECIES: YicC/YloC family endoribonuclease [Pseudobutyrivibrio]MDC7278393.1 YicC family protein [Butyrivibrio fibrisolvens]SCZ81435.1 TIGR00255 family protein [Pseudobutyrivibrio xylanivorans]